MRFRTKRLRLSYANVASSLALFVALGGTSYAALALPRNSVGAAQLRTGAVGTRELRNGAVRSADVRNGALTVRDLSKKARAALRGSRGPAGPPGVTPTRDFIEADSAGGHEIGNGLVTGHPDTGVVVVTFPHSVAACALVASPAIVPGGLTDAAPPGSTVVVSHDGGNAVVHTYGAENQPTGLPFSLIAAC